MNPNERQIIEQIIKRAGTGFNLTDHCFKEQLDFINDRADYIAACCSRRAGKTEACAADLITTALRNPESPALYLTLTRKNAKRIIWPILLRLNRQYKLGGIPNETDLVLSFPGKSTIFVSGAKDKTEIQNFLGVPFKKVYIDEAQSFRDYINELVDDVLAPTLIDYAGQLRLIGTPGPIPSGYFYDACNSKQWSYHGWTMHQNPWITKKSGRTVQDIIQRELTRRGVTIDHPSIQREYFGRWVMDAEALVYKYNESVNHYDALPPGKYVYIMGIDFGYEDSDALAVIAWAENSPVTYLVDEIVTPKQGITELVQQIESLRSKYQISKMVADFGGLGKKIAEEISRRYQIPLQAADKARKIESIELLNDSLRTGRFRAKRTSRFASDSQLVEWDFDKSTPEKRVISDNFHSDILDAVLYSFKESPAYSWTPEVVKPAYGTPEWGKMQAEELEQAAEEHFKALEDANQWDW